MENIIKKMAADFNLFSLNDMETTKFYVQNIDFFINNFPYFIDLPLVSSFFCSDNKKFNSKFFTRITKFMEIVKYDASAGDGEIRETCESKTQPSRGKSLPPFFAQFLKETDSKPFTLDSDSDGEQDVLKSPKISSSDNLDVIKAVEKLKIKTERPNSLIEIKNNPNFPNHFPVGKAFVVNPTRTVMKHFASVLNFHQGKFIVTPHFINQLIKKIEFEEIADLLCKLVNQNGVLNTIAKSQNLKEIFLKNLNVLEMILENFSSCEIGAQDEEMLADQIFKEKDFLIYHFFEDGILQGYVEPDLFTNVELDIEGYGNELGVDTNNYNSNDMTNEKEHKLYSEDKFIVDPNINDHNSNGIINEKENNLYSEDKAVVDSNFNNSNNNGIINVKENNLYSQDKSEMVDFNFNNSNSNGIIDVKEYNLYFEDKAVIDINSNISNSNGEINEKEHSLHSKSVSVMNSNINNSNSNGIINVEDVSSSIENINHEKDSTTFHSNENAHVDQSNENSMVNCNNDSTTFHSNRNIHSSQSNDENTLDKDQNSISVKNANRNNALVPVQSNENTVGNQSKDNSMVNCNNPLITVQPNENTQVNDTENGISDRFGTGSSGIEKSFANPLSMKLNNSPCVLSNEFKGQFTRLEKLKKSEIQIPHVFPSAYTTLQFVCSHKSEIKIPEIKMTVINRFSLFYFRLLSYNKFHSKENLSFLLNLFYQYTHCSHLLYSISRIFLGTSPEILWEIGLFEKLKTSVFSYAHTYNTVGVGDSLFAFLIKIYAKFKNFLEKNETADSWKSVHVIMEYFMRLEKYGYRPEDSESILEYEGFNRFIIDTMISELPFSTVFAREL